MSAPLSRPTRTRSGARFLISLTMAVGSDATLPSKTRVPSWSRMQTLVSLSDTSSPTNVSMATLPWLETEASSTTHGESRRD